MVSFSGTTDEQFFSEKEMGGVPWESKETHLSNSPLWAADSFATPTMVLHGDADRLVHLCRGGTGAQCGVDVEGDAVLAPRGDADRHRHQFLRGGRQLAGGHGGSLDHLEDLPPRRERRRVDAHDAVDRLEAAGIDGADEIAPFCDGLDDAAASAQLGIDAGAELSRIAGESLGEGVVLIEGIHPLHRWDGTITGRMSFPQIINPYCDIWIGEEAAGDLGVEAGSTVALATELGETTIIATVTDRMPGGLVAVPSYVPDVRGLLAWTVNPITKWFDVAAQGAKVTPGT